MEEISGGMIAGEVGAGAVVGALRGIGTMRSVHSLVVVVVLVEEILTGLMAAMVGSLEAVVLLDLEEKEVEVLQAGIGAPSEKVVQKGGLKLSNGTGRRNKMTLVLRTILAMIMMNLRKMVVILVTIRYSNSTYLDQNEKIPCNKCGK